MEDVTNVLNLKFDWTNFRCYQPADLGKSENDCGVRESGAPDIALYGTAGGDVAKG